MNNATKCGEIFLNNQSGEFLFFCTFSFCGATMHDLGKFADHLFMVHNDRIESAMNDVATTSEDFNIAEEMELIRSNIIEAYNQPILMENENQQGNKITDIHTLPIAEQQHGSTSKTGLKKKSVTFETSPPKTYNYTPNNSSNSNSSASNSTESNSENECNTCGKTFESYGNLQHHKAMKHSTSTSGFKIRSSPPPKSKHILPSLQHPYIDYDTITHPYACKFCEKRFKSKQYHRIHERLHNDEDFATRFQCDHCDKTFFNETHLSTHMEIHKKNRKKYECTFCKKKFVTENYLEEHKKLKHLCGNSGNTSGINLSGNAVGISASSGSSSANDNNLASDRAKFVKCPYCPLKYSPAYLPIHELKHTQGPQHQCDFCERKFLTKGQKVAHIKNRHSEKEKEFFCPICNKAFYTKGNMQQHVKKQHEISF